MFSALVVASASVSTDNGSDVVNRVLLTSCSKEMRGLHCAVAHRKLRSMSFVSNSACLDCHLVAAFGGKDVASERARLILFHRFPLLVMQHAFFFALVLRDWRTMIPRRRWQCLRQLAVSWALVTSAAQQIETLRMSLYSCC